MSELKNKLKDAISDVVEEVKEEFDELKENKGKKSKKKSSKKKTTLIMVAVIVALFILCVILLVASFTIKSRAAKDAYTDSKAASIDNSYNDIGQRIFELGEKRYHTSNEIGISIDGIEKVSSLETLEVTEIDYYIHNGDKEVKSEAWYKITGSGIFTVNMELAEIITDEERNYILIRVPAPTLQLNDFDVTVKEFHFDKKSFEGVDVGEGIAAKAEKEGYKNIKAKILANQDYFNCAKNTAEAQLIELAKECNPNLEIEVDVEFF